MAETDTRDITIKRLAMRSMRRGMKEMDLILSGFADTQMRSLGDRDLETYEAMLHENDQDIYDWILGRSTPPELYAPLIAQIKSTLPGN